MTDAPRRARCARHLLRLVVQVGLLVALPWTVPEAQQASPTDARGPEMAESAVSASLANRVQARWWRRHGLLATGDGAAAAAAGDEIVGFAEDRRIGRLEAMGSAAAHQGHREAELERLAVAAGSYRLAHAIDPLSAAGWWGEARMHAKSGQWGEAIGLAWRALTARFGAFWGRFSDLASLATSLFAGLLLAGAFAALILFLRHAPLLVQSVDSRLPARWIRDWRLVIGWAVVLLPVLLMVAGVWALLIWVVVVIPLAGVRARSMLYAWLLVVALTPPAIGGLRLMAEFAASEPARTALGAAEGSLTADQAARLRRLVEKYPDEAIWKVQLAELVAPAQPNLAVPLLRDAARSDAADPRIRVAIGNVLYRVGKHEGAAVHYRDALDLDRENVLALFNLARTHLAVLEFEPGNDALRRAKKIDDEMVEALEAVTDEDEVADPVYPVSETARRILSGETSGRVREALSPLNPISLIAIGAMLAAFGLGIRKGDPDFRRCETCGRPADVRTAEIDAVGHCTACEQVLSRREGLAPAARREQLRRINDYLGRLSRARTVLQALWPGLGLVHEGRAWMGWLMASLWAALLIGGLFPGWLIPLPLASRTWTPGLVFLVLAALVWLVFQLPGLRPRRIGAGSGR